MKKTIDFLTVFALLHMSYGTVKNSYDGQPQTAIEKMLQDQGIAYDIVDEPTFNAVPDKLPKTQATMDFEAAKAQAVADAKNNKLDPQTRLDALIKTMGL
jgi:hypothetical protein